MKDYELEKKDVPGNRIVGAVADTQETIDFVQSIVHNTCVRGYYSMQRETSNEASNRQGQIEKRLQSKLRSIK